MPLPFMDGLPEIEKCSPSPTRGKFEWWALPPFCRRSFSWGEIFHFYGGDKTGQFLGHFFVLEGSYFQNFFLLKIDPFEFSLQKTIFF